MTVPFRLNQRVCRVHWRKGHPYVEIGTVTKITPRTYHVNGNVGRSWFTNWRAAVRREYRELFQMWGIISGPNLRPEDWTIEDTIRCVCRLRRLKRRLKRRPRKETT